MREAAWGLTSCEAPLWGGWVNAASRPEKHTLKKHLFLGTNWAEYLAQRIFVHDSISSIPQNNALNVCQLFGKYEFHSYKKFSFGLVCVDGVSGYIAVELNKIN